jgi:hypothetical protein
MTRPLARAALAVLLAAALVAGRSAAGGEKAADFSGTWNASYGDLVLKQTGAEATGVYGQSAREAFNANNPECGYAAYQEIVDEHYASSWYRLAKKWIAEKK